MKSGMFGAEAWLQGHRHEIAAHPEKHALAEAENSAVPPDEDDANGGNREAQVLGHDAHAKFVERQRENHQQQYRENNEPDNVQLSRDQPCSGNRRHRRTFEANSPLGLK